VPVHNFDPPAGSLERIEIDSRALRDNLLGDPHRRSVWVYLAPGHAEARSPLPLLVGLAGFTGSGPKLLAWQSFGESLPQRIDRLVANHRMGPVALALPDCFTSLGGNQYVDSVALGRWEEFLLAEMLPELERRFDVARKPSGRAVFGKSSGGYGALVQALRHGESWGAVACHSGDVGFEIAYLRDLPGALDALARHGGDVRAFVEHLRASSKIGGGEFHALMLLAMCASYDPDPAAPLGVRLPVDPHTCEMLEERWRRWQHHDPLRMVERPDCRRSLASLRALFIDCGSRDQYGLHYGARALVRRLERHGIRHRYEEFDDDHSGLDYRLDRSLPFLYEALEV
jgi:S-formylglutathione hydrolase FrmB